MKKHHNLFLLAIGIVVALVLAWYEPFHALIENLGSLGYLGALIGGMLFVITFTLPIGAIIIGVLSPELPLIPMALVASLGGLCGDYLIFRFVRNTLIDELTPLYNALGGAHLTHLLRTKFFSWTLPVIGAIIIASPLPDELGVSLMGITRMKTSTFALISFTFNVIGFLIVIGAARLISSV